MSLSLVRFVLKAALRDRLMIMMVVMIALMASVSNFLGSSALTESQNFAQVIAAGSLRLLSVIGLIVFIAFQVRRAFENREVEYLLATPIKRRQFVVSFAAGFSILALFIGIAVGGAVAYLSPDYGAGFVLWTVSLLAELLIVANLALFFSIVLRSAAVSVLSTLGFYVLARLIGTLIGIVQAGGLETPLMQAFGKVMILISMVVPRLDLFAQTSWLVYGAEGDGVISYGFLAAQLVIFVAMTLFAALFDFQRKEF